MITHQDGLKGTLQGQARIEAAGADRATYMEEGKLRLGQGEPLHATRTYLWRGRPGVIEVSFDDGRPFHMVPLEDLSPSAVHLCPPDRYQVTYDFETWPRWTSKWDVEGPAKAYRMVTTYTRIDR